MKRRSRIAEVIAAVPTAAQAACRINSRRLYLEKDCWSINLPLDGVIGRIEDHMHNRADAVPHLGISRRCAVGEVTGVGNIADDLRAGGSGQLAATEQRIHLV